MNREAYLQSVIDKMVGVVSASREALRAMESLGERRTTVRVLGAAMALRMALERYDDLQ